MSEPTQRLFRSAQIWAQLVAMSIISLAAAGAAIALFAAAAGAIAWPEVPVLLDGETPVDIGAPVLLAGCLILVSLCAYLPSALRVMRLEATHRDFSIRMEDVARAYWAAHRADRSGIFTLGREFDAVRERARFLMEHPDLGDLDHEILELAAQMSTESRELAALYSDDRVARAREGIARRAEDAARLERQIDAAHLACSELRRDLESAEVDEAVIRSRLARLDEELAELHDVAAPKPVAADPERRRASFRIAPGE